MIGEAITTANTTCGAEVPEAQDETYETPDCNMTENQMISIQCFPNALTPESKFGYTLFFLLVPWPFFIYEFFTSRQYQRYVIKGGIHKPCGH